METCLLSKTVRGQSTTERLIVMCENNGPFNYFPSKHGSATHRQTQALNPINLRPVDALDVTIIVDNAIDILLPSDERTKRPPLTWDWSENNS